MLKLFIVDSHPLYREALSQFIDQVSTFRLLESLSHPQALLAWPGPAPDAIILQHRPAGKEPGPLPWVQKIRARWPEVALLLQGIPTEAEAHAAQGLPRLAWLSRQQATEALLPTLDRLVREDIAPQAGPLSSQETAAQGWSQRLGLTRTEMALWEGYVRGVSALELASWLGLRRATWQATHQNLMAKLDVSTLWGLHHLARRYGLFPDRDLEK